MMTGATYADVFLPSGRRSALVYDTVLIVVGSLLIGLCAQVALVLPFSAVPVTGQTFAVLILGAVLGSSRGSLAVLAYIIEGVMGLPIFALGRSGPLVLVSPTGGYLIGFIAAAYITGWLAEKGWDRRAGTTAVAMVLGNLAIYGFGVGWLSCLIGIKTAVVSGVYPFLAGDVLKIALAMALLPSGWKILNKIKN